MVRAGYFRVFTVLIAATALLILEGCGSNDNNQWNGGSNGNAASSDNPCDHLNEMDPGMRQNMQVSCNLGAGNAEAQKIASGKATPEEQAAFERKNQIQGAQAGAAAVQAGDEARRNGQGNAQQGADDARQGAMNAWCDRNAPSGCGSP